MIYGGGPFNLVDAKIDGTTTVEFTGAAANALAMLDLLKGINLGQSPNHFLPERRSREMRNPTQPPKSRY